MIKMLGGISFIAVIVALLGACTIRHVYTPELHPQKAEWFASLDSVSISDPVAVKNAQDSEDELFLGKIGAHAYYGSLHSLTQSAVKATKAALRTRQIDVRDDAEKTLNLSVTSGSVVHGMWVVRAVIDMEAETGSGIKTIYHAENATPGTVPRAYNGAAALAAKKLLSDKIILEYLTADHPGSAPVVSDSALGHL